MLICNSADAERARDTYLQMAAFQSFQIGQPGPFIPSNFFPTFNDASANWKNAGLAVIGGIPTRSTVCATVTPSGVTPPGSGDDATRWAMAVAACTTAGQVLQVNGMLQIAMSELPLSITSSITLRGVGSCTNGASPYCPSGVTVYDGAISWSGGLCGHSKIAISSGTYNTSTFVITITTATAHPFSVGQQVVLSSLTGTGAFASLDGSWTALSGTTGSTIVLAGPNPSAGAATITGGSATPGCLNVPTTQFQPDAAANQFDFGFTGQLGSCSIISSAIGCGTQFDADAAKGDTTIQVHSTTGFSVGQWVMIDEASGAQFVNDPVGPNIYGQVWASPDWLNTSGTPATGRVAWPKYGNGTGDMGPGQYPYNSPGTIQSMYDRATTEIHLITAVANNSNCPGVGCTITFDDPLMVAFRRSGNYTFTTGTFAGTTFTTTGDSCQMQVAGIIADASGTGAAVLDGTYVTAVNSCSGGVGNYTVNLSQTVTARAMIGLAHQAHIYIPARQNGTPMAFLTQAGIENLSIVNPQAGGINFQYCAYCWRYGVEVVGWVGGAFNDTYTARIQTQFSLSNHCAVSTNNGAEYPYGFQDSATESLFEDSIVLMCGKGMVGKAASGIVVAYVYADMTMYDIFSLIGNYWLDFDINCSHWSGTHDCLFEGNWGNNCDNDNTHGNDVYMTFLRNNCTGLRTNFTDPSMVANGNSANAAVSDFSGIGWETTSGLPGMADSPAFLRAAGPMVHNYWHAYLGNVMGTASKTTTGNSWSSSGSFATNKVLWAPGWQSDSSQPSVVDPNLNNGLNTFLFRNCNYDYVSASQADCATGYSHTFPNSLYLPSSGASPPSWWPSGSTTYPFPWIDASSGTPIKSNSIGGSGLPAKARWDAGTPFVQP